MQAILTLLSLIALLVRKCVLPVLSHYVIIIVIITALAPPMAKIVNLVLRIAPILTLSLLRFKGSVQRLVQSSQHSVHQEACILLSLSSA